MAAPIRKGKARANEQTPLLDDQGHPIGNRIPGNNTRRIDAPGGAQTMLSSHLSGRVLWRSYLITAVLVILTLFFGLMLVIVLLTDSYAAPAWHNVSKALSQSGEESDKFWKQAMIVRGPDAVSIQGIDRRRDESGVVRLEVKMTVAMRIAADTDFIMDFRDDGTLDNTWWRERWRALGRWGVRRLGRTTITMDDIVITPSKLSPSDALLTIKALSPITVPLRPGLSAEDHRNPPSSLQTVYVPLTICPSQNGSLLSEFVKQSWKDGYVSVGIRGTNFSIHGGSGHTAPPKVWELGRWRNWFKFGWDDLTLDLTWPIPPFHIPSLPTKPKTGLPKLSDILVLEAFNITSTASDPGLPGSSSGIHVTDTHTSTPIVDRDQQVLAHQTGSTLNGPSKRTSKPVPANRHTLIFARASLAHPFPSLASKLDLGHNVPPLPFIVSLPVLPKDDRLSISTEHIHHDTIPVVEVYAVPEFNATHIIIPLSGHVLPFADPSVHLPDAISAFVTSYLSYRPAPISISSPFYPSLEVSAEFPPPRHRLELVRDVKVENMNIRPGLLSNDLPIQDRDIFLDGSMRMMDILASATIHARVVFPRGIDLDVRVTRLWVDCFVFDGEAPPESTRVHVMRSHDPADPSSSAVRPLSDDDDPPLPQPLPLPTPLPMRAFGRITPRTWLNATSTNVPHLDDCDNYPDDAARKEGSDTGTNVFVTAQVVDVPLEVLPGRQGALSRFVSKVLFSKDPVVAGIRGVAAVGLSIPGLTIPAASGPRIEGNELILTGLPFEGNVKVGGRDFLNSKSVPM